MSKTGEMPRKETRYRLSVSLFTVRAFSLRAVRFEIAAWQIYDKPLSITACISLINFEIYFLDDWQAAIGGRGSKDGEGGEVGWRGRRACGGSVVPNWNEMAESQKEIHSPSTSAPVILHGEGLYHETISRHEQKFSSLVPPRCDVPQLFFFPPWPLFLSVAARGST